MSTKTQDIADLHRRAQEAKRVRDEEHAARAQAEEREAFAAETERLVRTISATLGFEVSPERIREGQFDEDMGPQVFVEMEGYSLTRRGSLIAIRPCARCNEPQQAFVAALADLGDFIAMPPHTERDHEHIDARRANAIERRARLETDYQGQALRFLQDGDTGAAITHALLHLADSLPAE